MDGCVKKGGGTGKLSEAKTTAAARKAAAVDEEEEGGEGGGDGDEWLWPAMSKIEAVVAAHRTKQPFWPCPLTEHAQHPEAGGGATHRAKNKKTSAERAAKQKESEPEPAPDAPAVPRTAEEPNAKAIADAAAAAAAGKKAAEDAVRVAEENTLAAAEEVARLLADRHNQQMGGERHDAKNLRTDLSKGFGFGLASKLRIEGTPFDYLIPCFSFGASSLRLFCLLSPL